jgi:peptidylprolyl isomerase
MAEAKLGNKVKVHYAVNLEDGTTFDSTFNLEPIVFTIGLQQVIIGFEDAVIGMSTGTVKTVRIPSEEAYGPYDKNLVTEMDRAEFPEDFELEVGQHLQIIQPDGQPAVETVLSVSDKTVTLDKNHPLAGKDLIIDIQLLEIL